MYIYLIKYYNKVIAAADGDTKADEVIRQYMRNNKDMKIENFSKEAVRFFCHSISPDEICIVKDCGTRINMTTQNQDCIHLVEHTYNRCEDCYNYEFCKEENNEV